MYTYIYAYIATVIQKHAHIIVKCASTKQKPAGKCKRAPSPRLTSNHNWQQARAVASCSTRAKPLACALPHANENRVPSLVTRRAPRLRFTRIIHANGVILNEN